MKFVSYLACLPPNNKNSEKNEILDRFPLGVTYLGKDEVIVQEHKKLLDADVALMVGWVHENSKDTPHLAFRNQIIQHQKIRGKRVLLADSNLFLYRDKTNPHHYLRYSFDGIFPNTGNYCDSTVDPRRWDKIKKTVGFDLKDYRKNGNHILLCLQRNGGWSMGGFDVVEWTAQTIKMLRVHTDREIVIRAHPGDKGSKSYLSPNNLIKKIGLLKGVRLSKPGADLIDDLKNCWAVVNYNSSPAVAAAIEGYPIFVTDAARSQCSEIANTYLKNIESPEMFDRQKWIERISMFHWNFDEISNGECWSHMRNFV
jgi:hypothetical protein